MPRRPRDHAPGLFHITAHSVWSVELFPDDLDRFLFCSELASTVARFHWTCISACVMTTHYHLILEVDDDSLPQGMQQLNFRYAIGFNARRRLRGHAFGSRYSSNRIESDGYLASVYRYVVRNPVRAGICDRPEEWPWSSWATAIGAADTFDFVDPSRVIGYFGDDPESALERLRTFVETP